MLSTIKKMFLWNYARNTWQWDVLCVVILVFIFLTPKSWFESGERGRVEGHQSPAITTVLMGAEAVENEADTSVLEQRVRTLSGRADAKVVAVRKVLDQHGKTVGYQVDIR